VITEEVARFRVRGTADYKRLLLRQLRAHFLEVCAGLVVDEIGDLVQIA
jgi:hypothetical protein